MTSGLARALLGAGVAYAGARAPLPGPAEHWLRTNHRGAPVSLAGGPALAVAASLAVAVHRPAALVAGLAAGLAGGYDDRTDVPPGAGRGRAGAAPGSGPADDDGTAVSLRPAKGVRGHVAALRAGRVTGGTVKVLAISGAGLLSAALLPDRGRAPDVLLRAGVVAGAANLVNLLDLRPGRALKAGLLAAGALRQPGVAGAVVVLLPEDLRERTMLGDAGANALGAVLGLAFAAGTPDRRRLGAALAVLTALTAASEVVSFSRVIDAVAPLRALDRLGRRA